MNTDAIDPTGTVGAKIGLVKEIRRYTGLGLLEAKLIADGIQTTFVPSADSKIDPYHAHNPHAVTVTRRSVCLHCGALMPREDWGTVFCGEMCVRAHRSSVRQDNHGFILDQQIRDAEFRLEELRNRRANLTAE